MFDIIIFIKDVREDLGNSHLTVSTNVKIRMITCVSQASILSSINLLKIKVKGRRVGGRDGRK